MCKDLVSVIVPAYNSENTIKRAIDSIRRQTYPFWELIIVDDGSTDNTTSIVQKYIKIDSKIKLIINNHSGAAKARNTGLDVAKGTYISFLDSDDWLDTNFFATGLKKLNEEKADVAIYDLVRVGGDEIYRQKVGTGIFNSYTGSCNKLYKKELWEDIRFPENLVIEDMETIPVVVARANKSIKINDAVYFYFQRESSLTHDSTLEQGLEIKDAIDILNKNFKQFNIKYDKNEYALFINNIVYWHLVLAIENSSAKEVKQKAYKKIYNCFVLDKGILKFGGSKRYEFRRKWVINLFKLHMFRPAIFLARLSL